MSRYRRFLGVGVCLVLAGGAADAAAQGRPQANIGFRYDGTGVFPADCRPPTEFDGITGKNLAWKAALPNFCNGSPIVVAGKVFVVCEAGWPEGQDTALLVCFDAASGRELWRRDLDEFATMPPDRAKEARLIRREYYRRIRALNRLLYEYQSAGEARRGAILQEAAGLGAAKEESFERHSWGTGSAEQGVYTKREFSRRLREVCAYSPITWSPTCLGVNMPTPVSDGRRVFVYTGRRTVHAFDLDGNCLWQVWQSDAPYNYHWVTDCANNPILADGLLLMYCFDHLWAYETDTGQLRYATESKVPFRHGMGNPVLLHLPAGGPAKTEAAVFLWTGDLVRVRDGRVLLKRLVPVSCASLSGDGADRVFLGVHAPPSAVASGKGEDAEWLVRPEGEGGALGVRLVLEGDAARPEKLWFTEKNDGYKQLGPYPLHRDGRLWIESGHVVAAATGRPIHTPKRRTDIAYNGFILAGGRLYGIQKSQINRGSGGASGLGVQADHTLNGTVATLGTDGLEDVRLCPIDFFPARITDPAKKNQVVAITGKDRYQDWYGWHEAYSAPFAAGNRLFVRTFDHLYCFGDKGEPFAPSKSIETRR